MYQNLGPFVLNALKSKMQKIACGISTFSTRETSKSHGLMPPQLHPYIRQHSSPWRSLNVGKKRNFKGSKQWAMKNPQRSQNNPADHMGRKLRFSSPGKIHQSNVLSTGRGKGGNKGLSAHLQPFLTYLCTSVEKLKSAEHLKLHYSERSRLWVHTMEAFLLDTYVERQKESWKLSTSRDQALRAKFLSGVTSFSSVELELHQGWIWPWETTAKGSREHMRTVEWLITKNNQRPM